MLTLARSWCHGDENGGDGGEDDDDDDVLCCPKVRPESRDEPTSRTFQV